MRLILTGQAGERNSDGGIKRPRNSSAEGKAHATKLVNHIRTKQYMFFVFACLVFHYPPRLEITTAYSFVCL
jgi:hypothetical protein